MSKWILWSAQPPTKPGFYWVAGYWPAGYYDEKGFPTKERTCDRRIPSFVTPTVVNFDEDALKHYSDPEMMTCLMGFPPERMMWRGPIEMPCIPRGAELDLEGQ